MQIFYEPGDPADSPNLEISRAEQERNAQAESAKKLALILRDFNISIVKSHGNYRIVFHNTANHLSFNLNYNPDSDQLEDLFSVFGNTIFESGSRSSTFSSRCEEFFQSVFDIDTSGTDYKKNLLLLLDTCDIRNKSVHSKIHTLEDWMWLQVAMGKTIIVNSPVLGQNKFALQSENASISVHYSWKAFKRANRIPSDVTEDSFIALMQEIQKLKSRISKESLEEGEAPNTQASQLIISFNLPHGIYDDIIGGNVTISPQPIQAPQELILPPVRVSSGLPARTSRTTTETEELTGTSAEIKNPKQLLMELNARGFVITGMGRSIFGIEFIADIRGDTAMKIINADKKLMWYDPWLVSYVLKKKSLKEIAKILGLGVGDTVIDALNKEVVHLEQRKWRSRETIAWYKVGLEKLFLKWGLCIRKRGNRGYIFQQAAGTATQISSQVWSEPIATYLSRFLNNVDVPQFLAHALGEYGMDIGPYCLQSALEDILERPLPKDMSLVDKIIALKTIGVTFTMSHYNAFVIRDMANIRPLQTAVSIRSLDTSLKSLGVPEEYLFGAKVLGDLSSPQMTDAIEAAKSPAAFEGFSKRCLGYTASQRPSES